MTTTTIPADAPADNAAAADASKTNAAVVAPANPADAPAASNVAAAVQAENQRIMGILDCEEAKGREATARALAGTPGMTVEDAQRILATAPLNAQARTEIGFDSMLDDTPAAVSGAASAQAAAEDDGWDNIPV